MLKPLKFLVFSILILFPLAERVQAEPIVLDFEGLTTSSSEDITANNQGYGGLTWTTGNHWTLVNFTDFRVASLSGSYGLLNNFGGTNTVTSETPFDFVGVSIAATPPNGWSYTDPIAPVEIGIRAYDADDNLVGDTGYLWVYTSAYTYFAAGFTDISSLEFYGDEVFIMDDFILGRVALPAPNVMILMLIGLIGLVYFGRESHLLRARP